MLRPAAIVWLVHLFICYGAAQCPTSSITLSSQAEVDNFPVDYPGCTEIFGNYTITVSGSDIVNVDGLSQLEFMFQGIQIHDNPVLTDLSGLTLNSLNFISIQDNDILQKVNGFGNVTSLNSVLRVRNNPALTELDSLDDITSVGSLEITNNDMLADISDLFQLSGSTGNVKIEGNAILTSLSPLSNLTSVNSLEVDDNDHLSSLDGLENITGSLQSLTVSYNDMLSDISQLSGITSVTNAVVIQAHPLLASLTGIQNITSIGGLLWIIDNPLIPTLGQLSNITNLGSSLRIHGNDALADLTGLDNLTSVSTNVEIQNNASLADISALSSLVSVQRITILNNDALVSLTGLHNIPPEMLQVTIQNNALLTDISALANLEKTTGNVQFSGNDILADLTGLENLDTIGGALIITSNPQIANLDVFNTATLLSVGGITNIQFNTSLSDCFGLCPLYVYGENGGFVFSSNASGCNSLSEFETTCAPLPVELIDFHAELIGGAVHLQWQTAQETHSDYFHLEHSTGDRFAVLQQIPASGSTAHLQNYQYTHYHPATGKNYYRLRPYDRDGTSGTSQIVVIDIPDLPEELRIFPSPATTRISLRLADEHRAYEILTIDGRVVKKGISGDGQIIDIADLRRGVYILHIRDAYARFIKM